MAASLPETRLDEKAPLMRQERSAHSWMKSTPATYAEERRRWVNTLPERFRFTAVAMAPSWVSPSLRSRRSRPAR